MPAETARRVSPPKQAGRVQPENGRRSRRRPWTPMGEVRRDALRQVLTAPRAPLVVESHRSGRVGVLDFPAFLDHWGPC